MTHIVTAILQRIKCDDTHSYYCFTRGLNLMTHIVTAVLHRIKYDDTQSYYCFARD